MKYFYQIEIINNRKTVKKLAVKTNQELAIHDYLRKHFYKKFGTSVQKSVSFIMGKYKYNK